MKIHAMALALACSLPCIAQAQSSEDFFKDKQLRMIVGFGPGTGNDIYMRHLMKHIANHLPGKPTIVPVNMPGAASLTMTNYLYNVAPSDGTVVGMPSRNLLIEPLLGNAQAKFDALKFTYLGSVSRETGLCFTWHTSGITNIERAKKEEVLVGSTSPSSVSSIFPLSLNALFGTKFKPITGYPDSAAVGLAMERGEVKGYCSFPLAAVRSARPQWLENKQINILLQLATRADPDLPGVPLVMDLAQSDEQRQMMTLLFADQEMGRPLVGPPGMNAARTADWRRAFDATMADRDFLEEAKKLKLTVDGPISGAEVEKVVARLYSTPPHIAEAVRKMRETN
ncbi:MAG: Bug family tripartite tricarboxylate transporter substrate binding protein [Beijerinckiaceae bacterium]